MRNFFDNWKYIVKNIWFVLPLAIVPAIFLALALDFGAISEFVRGFLGGSPRFGFDTYFRVWSLVRIDSVLGAIYSVLAFVCVFVFVAILLTFVEKHMRIGKRTVSGVYQGFLNIVFYSFLVTFIYFLCYELWALLLSALLFALSAINVTPVVYVFSLIVIFGFICALLFIAATFFLWLPCRQMTGFGFYDSFLYSYRLMTGIRAKLVVSFFIALVLTFLALGGVSLLSELVFRIVAVVIMCGLFMSFCVRMEASYFETDKIDREDLLHSYKEY